MSMRVCVCDRLFCKTDIHRHTHTHTYTHTHTHTHTHTLTDGLPDQLTERLTCSLFSEWPRAKCLLVWTHALMICVQFGPIFGSCSSSFSTAAPAAFSGPSVAAGEAFADRFEGRCEARLAAGGAPCEGELNSAPADVD